METIHIDRYDAAQNDGAETSKGEAPKGEAPWFQRFVPEGFTVPGSVVEASRKVTSFVKERPGVAIAAAVGIGLLATGGLRRHPLLKAAFGVFGVPYLQRRLVPAR